MERSGKEVSLMLGNNNKKILNKLAKNTLRRNKKQMSILFLTICLSAFMLFSVFTLGITYLDLGRQQDTRLNGAEYDIALMNGFTEQQKESLEENSFQSPMPGMLRAQNTTTLWILACCGATRPSGRRRWLLPERKQKVSILRRKTS